MLDDNKWLTLAPKPTRDILNSSQLTDYIDYRRHLKAEREAPTDGTGELSIEFELEWDENGSEEMAGAAN